MKYSILVLLFLFSISSFAQKGDLTVNISNIESNKGNVKIAVYDESGSAGFLRDIESAFVKKIVNIQNGKATVIFSNIPYGTYAVSAFHDINNNGELELAPIGFPLEPYAVSGNVKQIGPPRFEMSKFDFNADMKSVTIQMKRFQKK